jgi:hypothetical protein
MPESNIVVAAHDAHSRVEPGVGDLDESGFNTKKLSMVPGNPHTEEHVVSLWGQGGAFWGGVWGLLLGAAFFAIPGIGPVLVVVPLVAWKMLGGIGAIVTGLGAHPLLTHPLTSAARQATEPALAAR